MFDFDTINKTVILTLYFMIIAYDVWWIGYGIVSLMKWLWKKLHKKDKSSFEADNR